MIKKAVFPIAGLGTRFLSATNACAKQMLFLVAPTTLAVAGHYILTTGIFAELQNLPRGVGGEIQLTDGIANLLRREKVFAYRYRGGRYDCGSKLGFLQATVNWGENHAKVGAEFAEWLKTEKYDHSCYRLRRPDRQQFCPLMVVVSKRNRGEFLKNSGLKHKSVK